MIPLPVVAIVKELPYQSNYVISMRQLVLLKSGFYQESINRFQIISKNGWNEARIKKFKQKLPSGSKVGDPFVKGGFETLFVILDQKIPRVSIIKKLWMPHHQNIELWLGKQPDPGHDQYYTGAILPVNPILMDYYWDKDLLLRVQEFMENKSVKIHAEVIPYLQENYRNQENMTKMSNFFDAGVGALALILLVFFSVVLHTRRHRIGVLRILGMPDLQFVHIYTLEALIFVSFAFISAVIIFLLNPFGFSLNILSLPNLKMFLEITFSAVMGAVLPTFYFLKTLQPAEMVAYRV